MFTGKLTKAHESPGKAVKHCRRVTVQMRSYWFSREREDQKVTLLFTRVIYWKMKFQVIRNSQNRTKCKRANSKRRREKNEIKGLRKALISLHCLMGILFSG